MGTLTQRKRFDHIDGALQTRAWFVHPTFRIPGIDVVAEVMEIDGEIWLYVSHSGAIVHGNEPVLPDYERVA